MVKLRHIEQPLKLTTAESGPASLNSNHNDAFSQQPDTAKRYMQHKSRQSR